MRVERNLKLVLAYDGTAFHGWQRQAGLRTVQAELEQALQRVLRHPLAVHGASRTDAGVHARGQVATVLTETSIPVENVRRAVGHRLPEDLAIVHAAEAPREFHPARDARGKLYRYRIFNRRARPAPGLVQPYVWHVWYALDLDRLQAAAAALVGTHDFAGFASAGSPRASTVRTIRRLEVLRRYDEVVLDVEGDGFLYNQVRNIVGTLVEVGRGHWPVERMREVLTTCDRRRAGPTAPPQGLCLQWVQYGAVEDAAHGTA